MNGIRTLRKGFCLLVALVFFGVCGAETAEAFSVDLGKDATFIIQVIAVTLRG